MFWYYYPVSPVSPINGNEGEYEIKNLGIFANTEHKTSNDIMITPITKNQNHGQNSWNIDKNVDIEKRDISKSTAKMAIAVTKNLPNNSESLIQNKQQNSNVIIMMMKNSWQNKNI